MNPTNQGGAPQISIIVPIYNTAPYLKVCIDSVLTQTWRDLELILINDGSSDNSKAICEEACGQDSRVRLITYDENKGQSYARNRGIDAALGKYLFFLDSDDMIHPQLLEDMWKRAEENDADMLTINYISGGLGSNDEYKAFCKKTFKPQWQQYMGNELWEYWFTFRKSPFIGGKMFKAEAVGTLRFNENIFMGEDCLFNYMFLIKKSRKILISNASGYYYGIRENSCCNTKNYRKLIMHLKVHKYIRDSEYKHGRKNNAIFEEKVLVRRMRDQVCIEMGVSDQKVRKIKSMLKAECRTPFFKGLSIYQKSLCYFCLIDTTLFFRLRNVKRKIL